MSMNEVLLEYAMEYFRPNKEIIRSINRRYRKPTNTCFCGEKIKRIPDEKFIDYLELFG